MSNELLEILDWDSRHFGFPIARTRVPAFSKDDHDAFSVELKKLSARCVYHLADPANTGAVNLLNRYGFELAGTRIELIAPPKYLCRHPDFSSDVRIRTAIESDVEVLQDLAAASHHDTRFFTDTRFPPSRSEKLYRLWVSNGFHDPETTVLVADIENRAVGYATLTSEEDETFRIGLFAVSSAFRGKGIGGRLLDSLMEMGAHEGTCKGFKVAAQATAFPALRLYESRGFHISSLGLWYHHWVKQ